MKPKKPLKRNAPLSVRVVDNQLIITIGVSTLAYALQNGPQPFGGHITNDLSFARDVAVRLENDSSANGSEDTTALEHHLWKAAQSAMEWGSPYVHLDGDPQPSVYPLDLS